SRRSITCVTGPAAPSPVRGERAATHFLQYLPCCLNSRPARPLGAVRRVKRGIAPRALLQSLRPCYVPPAPFHISDTPRVLPAWAGFILRVAGREQTRGDRYAAHQRED